MTADETTDPGRRISLIDVYDELIVTKAEVVGLRKDVREMQRPVSFPRVPLWALVFAVLLHAALMKVP